MIRQEIAFKNLAKITLLRVLTLQYLQLCIILLYHLFVVSLILSFVDYQMDNPFLDVDDAQVYGEFGNALTKILYNYD